MTAPRRVLVTGGGGNLGGKLIAALLQATWCEQVVAIDRVPGVASDRVRWVQGDLTGADPAWTEALAGVDAVIHLAAQNPYPDASWADSAASFDMTAHLIEAAVAHGVGRVVFASSNHVMGGYKDTDVAVTPGALTTQLPPRTGTVWRSGETLLDSTAYAAAKLMGERLCAVRAGPFTAVSVRIGWCQPGANTPDTLSAAGTPKLAGEVAAPERDARWFQDMWLSNRDFCRGDAGCDVRRRGTLAGARDHRERHVRKSGHALGSGVSGSTDKLRWHGRRSKRSWVETEIAHD